MKWRFKLLYTGEQVCNYLNKLSNNLVKHKDIKLVNETETHIVVYYYHYKKIEY